MKFGVLGCGSIGDRHFKNLKVLGHEVDFYDPISHHATHRIDMINWADAVVVASPSTEHAKDLMSALDAGKHVFVEKPFGYDCPPLLEGFLKGAQMRHGNSKIVAAGFNLRFHECVIKAKNHIDRIGPIINAKFSVLQKSEKPEYLRDGVIRNWACHEMDLACHLLGGMEVVDCHAEHNANGQDQTWCIVEMKHPDIPNPIRVNADYTTEPQQRFFWIEGAGGTIYVNLLDRTMRIEWSHGGSPYEFKGIGSFDRDYQMEMLHFAGSVKSGRHMEPLASGFQGVENLRHIMKARELARVS